MILLILVLFSPSLGHGQKLDEDDAKTTTTKAVNQLMIRGFNVTSKPMLKKFNSSLDVSMKNLEKAIKEQELKLKQIEFNQTRMNLEKAKQNTEQEIRMKEERRNKTMKSKDTFGPPTT